MLIHILWSTNYGSFKPMQTWSAVLHVMDKQPNKYNTVGILLNPKFKVYYYVFKMHLFAYLMRFCLSYTTNKVLKSLKAIFAFMKQVQQLVLLQINGSLAYYYTLRSKYRLG